MIVKEKIIFWPLVAVFIAILAFGFVSHRKNKEMAEELLKEIEAATKKSRPGKKIQGESWDIDPLKNPDAIEKYGRLLKRSPFFRVVDEKESSEAKPQIVEKEKPREPALKYKGKVMMGAKVMVVIEDQGTGKSFFVQEGDMVGDFLVVRIEEKQVTMKKKGGEEVILSSIKKEEDE